MPDKSTSDIAHFFMMTLLDGSVDRYGQARISATLVGHTRGFATERPVPGSLITQEAGRFALFDLRLAFV
jgi:hypothetical protein